jgi:hypothetical protein
MDIKNEGKKFCKERAVFFFIGMLAMYLIGFLASAYTYNVISGVSYLFGAGAAALFAFFGFSKAVNGLVESE